MGGGENILSVAGKAVEISRTLRWKHQSLTAKIYDEINAAR
jgi:hypothetical protein